MYYSLLSVLKGAYEENLIQRADEYFAKLSPAAARDITISRFAASLSLNYSVGAAFFKRCVEIGFLTKHFVLRCPECNQLLQRFNSLAELPKEEMQCHHCGAIINSQNDEPHLCIDVAFSISDDSGPFVKRQQHASEDEQRSENVAAVPDSIDSAIRFRIVSSDELYHPTESEYSNLGELLKCVRTKKYDNTTAQGKTLENLCEALFSCCFVFQTTTKLRTETNQIDNFIRINQICANGFLGEIGQFFVVECKNEDSTPKGEYLSKLHSILHINGGQFGIVISRRQAPRTFRKIAHDVFLKDGIVFIWFSLKEIQEIIINQKNLLDEISTKYLETKVLATKKLSELNLC